MERLKRLRTTPSWIRRQSAFTHVSLLQSSIEGGLGMVRKFLLVLLGLAMSSTSDTSAGEKLATVWFGTRGEAKGIYRAIIDLESGKLGSAELAAEISNPGFLCINRAGDRIYSLGNVEDTDGNVAVYTVAADRRTLALLGTANTGCGKPTHISLSNDEKTLLLAHYGGGAIAALPIDPAGRILPPTSKIQHSGASVNRLRQDGPHPHWIGPTPKNHFVVVPDLGTDEVVVYRFDADKHELSRHGAGKVPPGSGPRHLKFHPNGKWAYVLNELGLTVTAFAYDAQRGALDRFQTVVALPDSERKDITTLGSEIRIHPNGHFVYAAIRGHDVIVVFEVDHESGKLTLVEREPVRGSWPRNFAIDPSGKWLLAAGAESSTVAVFRIDESTGRLVFTRQIIQVPEPICVDFLEH